MTYKVKLSCVTPHPTWIPVHVLAAPSDPAPVYCASGINAKSPKTWTLHVPAFVQEDLDKAPDSKLAPAKTHSDYCRHLENELARDISLSFHVSDFSCL